MAPQTSEELINSLKASNAQWAADVNKKDAAFFPETAKGQAPKILWIGCADSRVPESVILSRPPGDIFVHRNVANQFHDNDPSAMGLLQYAVEEVGCTEVIVSGHTGCGGAIAAYEGARDRLPISPTSILATWLTPLVTLAREIITSYTNSTHTHGHSHAHSHGVTHGKGAGAVNPDDKKGELVVRLIEENVRRQVRNLAETEIMKGVWAKGKNVTIHGWVYQLETGLINDLNISVHAPIPAVGTSAAAQILPVSARPSNIRRDSSPGIKARTG